MRNGRRSAWTSRSHHGEAAGGRRSARLQAARELRVERGDRDEDDGGLELRERAEKVGVARDEVVLRDDANRISEFEEHLQAGAREAQPALDGLVAISDAGKADDLWLPAGRP